jgi:glutamate transport system substrate-binding protein
MVAADLGFRRSEVRFLSIESEDRARRQATDVDGRRITVDLVIASYSITPAREADAAVSFSVPYLSTEQSVVTLTGHQPVSTLEDLRGKKVCTPPIAVDQQPEVRQRPDVREWPWERIEP